MKVLKIILEFKIWAIRKVELQISAQIIKKVSLLIDF
jgi:hypothetical protein